MWNDNSTTTTTSSANDNDGLMSFDGPTSIFIFIWALAFIFFLCLPCCANKSRRTNWCRRIKQRRWNVELVLDEDPSWYRVAAQRYEERRAREAEANSNETSPDALLSAAEKEEIRQIFLLEQLTRYTKTLGKDDFKTKSNTDNRSEDISPQQKETNSAEDDSNTSANEESGITTPMEADSNTSVDEEMGVKVDTDSSKSDKNNDKADTDIDNNYREKSTTTNPFTVVDDEMDVFESDEYVKVPFAGVSIVQLSEESGPLKSNDRNYCREVPNGCAICLCEFVSGDDITWSANDQCLHVFHQHCILNWMLAVGRKNKRRQRRNNTSQNNDTNNSSSNTAADNNESRQISGSETPDNDIEDGANSSDNASAIAKVVDFPMLCPCCRQRFVDNAPIDCLTETDTGSSLADDLPGEAAVDV